MKWKLPFALLLLLGIGRISAQVVLYTEGFETDGEGTRYTTNTYLDCPNSDFFLRTNTNPVTPPACSQMFGNALTSLQGSFFWASEDIRTSTPVPGSRPPGSILTQGINVAGYDSLTVSLYLATSGNNGARWESADSINIKASLDLGQFRTVGRFMGKGTPVVGARLGIDSNLDGAITGADPTTNCDTVAFTQYTFSIPNIGNSLRIEIDFDQLGGTEELAIDHIEVSGTAQSCTPPAITCPGTQSLPLGPTCGASLPDYTSLATVTGPCSPVTTQSPAGGATVNGAGATTITLTATNTALQTGTCSFVVTVEDNVPPTAACQDITILLNQFGMANITSGQIDDGSTDNCGPLLFSLSQTGFGCNDLGVNTVTLTVADTNGNSSTCTSLVTVGEVIHPMAICQDVTIYLDITGNAILNPSSIDGGCTDQCPTLTLSASPNTFNTSNIGANTVVLSATDGAGNVAMCTAIVTVLDTIIGVEDHIIPGIALEAAPSPVGEVLVLRVTCDGCEVGGILTVELWNVTGQRLLQQTIPADTGISTLEIPTLQLAAGTYLVALTDGNGFISRKVVKQ